MSNYRILEKEGKIIQQNVCPCFKMDEQDIEIPHTHGAQINTVKRLTYIPKFIVQSLDDYPDQMDFYAMLKDPDCHKDGFIWKKIKDIQEFTSLDEARKFKRSLELKEGIVRE